MTTTTAPMPLEDWQAAWRAHGGEAARFRCPACGHVAAGTDFVALGADAERVVQECLGRVQTPRAAGPDKAKRPAGPCDWAAFGFLGTMGEGLQVVTPDGNVLEAFPFADQEIFAV